jgi:hypothetical protein
MIGIPGQSIIPWFRNSAVPQALLFLRYPLEVLVEGQYQAQKQECLRNCGIAELRNKASPMAPIQFPSWHDNDLVGWFFQICF